MADRLQAQGTSAPAIGIVVNRVALARGVFEILRRDDIFDATLMIGRSRSVERDRIVKELAPFRTGAITRSEAKPLFVVATQCLEVGVDLDLDGLVTQAAPLDSLRQRFGRLNRNGREIPAEGAILARSEDIAKKADDPVYGDRIRLTWETLRRLAESDSVDFGVEALSERLEKECIGQDGLATKRPDAPVVMPAYLDLWSHTSPRPAADPDIGLFLHGTERTLAGVSIVWRGDISEDALKEAEARPSELDELFRLVPPRASEAIEVPLWAARAWLRQVRPDSTALDGMSDAPERPATTPEATANADSVRRAFRWAGAGDPRTGVVRPEDLRTGDLVIAPAEYGGCDEFGWASNSNDPVKDVADRAARPYWGRRCAVRVTRDIVQTDVQWGRVSTVLADESLAGSDLVERLLGVLPSAKASDAVDEGGDHPLPRDARKPLEALLRPRGRLELDIHFPYAGGREEGAVVVAERGVEDACAPDDGAPATEDDNLSHTSKQPVSLKQHSRGVERFAKQFARTLGLAKHADDLGLAAFLHDIGKADPRFQTMLSGGDPWNRPDGPALAKSGRPWSPRAWERAGLPKGWRHEALSVRMARAHPRFADAHDPRARPLADREPSRVGAPLFRFPRSCAGASTASVPRHRRLATLGGEAGAAVIGFRVSWRRLDVHLRGPQEAVRNMGAGSSGSDSAPRRSPNVGTGARVMTDFGIHRLDGLEPDNLLAFMALLGVLRVLETARPHWRPRVSWTVDEPPLRPCLRVEKGTPEVAIVEAAVEGLDTLARHHDFGELSDLTLRPDEATSETPGRGCLEPVHGRSVGGARQRRRDCS